jgi:polyisoprenoid-binding protein YceI
MDKLRRRGTRLRRLALVLALLAALPSGAADTHYDLVPGASIVRFEMRCLGLFSITGRFTTVEGTVVLAGEDGQTVAIDLTIPVRSLRLGSAIWRERLLGPSFFDAARYPDIRFAAREILPAGRGETLVSGTLKVHGIERALQLKASAESSPPELKVRAHAEIRRSEFGLGEVGPFVADVVRLQVELLARPAAPRAAVSGQGARAAATPPAATGRQVPAAAAANAAQTLTERGMPASPAPLAMSQRRTSAGAASGRRDQRSAAMPDTSAAASELPDTKS